MASKPRSEWSDAYRRRIESAERRGLSRAEARGHPEETPTGLGASVWRAIIKAAQTSVDCSLIEGPFGPGGRWTIVFIAVDEHGVDTTIDVMKGKKMTNAQRDEVKNRIRERLGELGLCVPAIGTP